MTLLRKESAGQAATALGTFTWDADGDAVDVPYEIALELLAIPDGGFSVAEPEPQADAADNGADEVPTAVSEPAPEPAAAVTEPAPEPASPADGPAKSGSRRGGTNGSKK